VIDGPYLEFERPIVDLEKKISDMRDFSAGEGIEMSGEISSLQGKLTKLREQIYSNLTRWQQVQLARHPRRPLTLDYLRRMTTDFIELHGDRNYADDKALIGGFGRIGDESVMIIGQQKGRDTKQKLHRKHEPDIDCNLGKQSRILLITKKKLQQARHHKEYLSKPS